MLPKILKTAEMSAINFLRIHKFILDGFYATLPPQRKEKLPYFKIEKNKKVFKEVTYESRGAAFNLL